MILLLFAPALVQLISGSQEAVVLNNGALYLRVVGPFYAVLGVLLETRYALQGLGAKMIPLVSSVIELLGKIVFAFVFIPRFQYLAVIFCEPVIWCLMTAQLIYAYATHPYIDVYKRQVNGLYSGICKRTKLLDLKSAMFASAPGGATDMSLIAADLGADLSQIALIQVLRAAYVVAVMPPLILGFIQWIG